MSDLDFIHRFVPAPGDKATARTLLLLHGTGGNENDLINFGRLIDPQAAILSPRGKVLERGAPRFFRRLAEGVFDEEDVVARAKELADFVRAAVQKYEIDAARLVAVGYSNGANIAAAMLLLGVAEFSGAILFRAMVPLHNITERAASAAEVLIAEGRLDPIARPEEGQTLAQMLREIGAGVDLVFQSAGHELTGEDVKLAQHWLEGKR